MENMKSEKKRGPGKPPVPAEKKLSASILIHMTPADKEMFEEYLSGKPKMSMGNFFREAGRAAMEADRCRKS